jgi:mannosyl-3-phosphoglycerate phosphatase
MGDNDKGKAVKVISRMFSVKCKPFTVGLGDSLNDLPMLKAVDKPILVQKKDGSYADLEVSGPIKADGIGPKGWNSAVLRL